MKYKILAFLILVAVTLSGCGLGKASPKSGKSRTDVSTEETSSNQPEGDDTSSSDGKTKKTDSDAPYIAASDLTGTTSAGAMWYYDGLNADEKLLYNRLGQAVDAQTSEIEVPASMGISIDALDDVVTAFVYDQPQIFWFEGNYAYHTPSDSQTVVKVDLSYNDLSQDLEAKKRAVREALDQYPKGSMLDSEYERFVHDRLCRNTAYTEDAEYNQTVYSCLIHQETVCSGFAKTFQLLMLRNGIECSTVSGECLSETGEREPHAWNIIHLGNGYYNVDVTWDHMEDRNAISYRCYNVTDGEIASDHFRSDSSCELPACNDTVFAFESLYNMTPDIASALSYSDGGLYIESEAAYRSALQDRITEHGAEEFTMTTVMTAELWDTVQPLLSDEAGVREIIDELKESTALSDSYSYRLSWQVTSLGDARIIELTMRIKAS